MSAPNIKYHIDWKKVDELLIAGCTIVEIAAHFGCDRDTLYVRFQKEHGSALSAYAEQKRLKGDNILRAHQYAKALGLTDKGDNTLLIWLGKTRLKQREVDLTAEPPKDAKVEAENKFMETSALLDKYIEKFGKLDDVCNQPEAKQELSGSDSSI